MKYWYPLSMDYPKELENYELLEYTDENNELAEELINKLEKIGKRTNSFMNIAKIIFIIRTLKIQNKNDNLKELFNEFLSHMPDNSIENLDGFQELLNEINSNDKNIELKLYNTVILLYKLFI